MPSSHASSRGIVGRRASGVYLSQLTWLLTRAGDAAVSAFDTGSPRCHSEHHFTQISVYTYRLWFRREFWRCRGLRGTLRLALCYITCVDDRMAATDLPMSAGHRLVGRRDSLVGVTHTASLGLPDLHCATQVGIGDKHARTPKKGRSVPHGGRQSRVRLDALQITDDDACVKIFKVKAREGSPCSQCD